MIYKGMKLPPVLSENDDAAITREKQEKKLYMVLIAIVIVFLICYSIPVINTVCMFIIKFTDVFSISLRKAPLWWMILLRINKLPMVVNASVNVIIYSHIDLTFRMYTFQGMKSMCKGKPFLCAGDRATHGQDGNAI